MTMFRISNSHVWMPVDTLRFDGLRWCLMFLLVPIRESENAFLERSRWFEVES